MKNLEDVKKMMLQCVVINWDGTLVSSAAMIHQAYLKTMQALQIHPEWSPEDTMRQNGRPPVEIFNDAGIWGSKAIGSVAKDFFYRGLEDIRKTKPELLRLKDGALDLLNWFANHPAFPRIVICGNKTQSILELEVKTFKLKGLVDIVIGSRMDSLDNKPQPEMFERAVEGLTIKNPAEEVLHIGDNPASIPLLQEPTALLQYWLPTRPPPDAASLTELLTKLK